MISMLIRNNMFKTVNNLNIKALFKHFKLREVICLKRFQTFQ